MHNKYDNSTEKSYQMKQVPSTSGMMMAFQVIGERMDYSINNTGTTGKYLGKKIICLTSKCIPD